MKISIIGAGKVGSSIAFSILHEIKPNELIINDLVLPLVKAEELDLGHASLSISPQTKIIGTTNIRDVKGSDFIIITAGKSRTYKETRKELLKINKEIIESICSKLSQIAPNTIVFVVTNPSTQMAEVAKQYCKNVIAMDNQLDTTRLKYNIKLETDLEEIKSIVTGDHGENMNFEIRDDLTDEQKEKVIHETKFSGLKIIEGKGHTNWGISAQVSKIIKEIIN
jgi:malate/lactate dehydrogenase